MELNATYSNDIKHIKNTIWINILIISCISSPPMFEIPYMEGRETFIVIDN